MYSTVESPRAHPHYLTLPGFGTNVSPLEEGGHMIEAGFGVDTAGAHPVPERLGILQHPGVCDVNYNGMVGNRTSLER